jgi:hypothetical protein
MNLFSSVHPHFLAPSGTLGKPISSTCYFELR